MKFVPTIYEHAASLIGKTPSQLAGNQEDLLAGQRKAYALYKHDLVSVGVDIYNVEAEALGGTVTYYKDNTLPSFDQILLQQPADFEGLQLPDPRTAGRMPMLIAACKQLQRELPVPVNGTVTGPFTLAAILRGYENFIGDLLDEPEFAHQLLAFTAEVGYRFALAYHENGCGVSINESWIAPPLCSPALYREFAFPYEQALIRRLSESGMKSVALISGGDTTAIVDDMVQTGTSLIMADWKCDRKRYKRLCAQQNILLRASIEATTVFEGDPARMEEQVRAIFTDCADYPKTIFGCGILSLDTPVAHVLALKKLVEKQSAEWQPHCPN